MYRVMQTIQKSHVKIKNTKLLALKILTSTSDRNVRIQFSFVGKVVPIAYCVENNFMNIL